MTVRNDPVSLAFQAMNSTAMHYATPRRQATHHRAAYLILLGEKDASKALLFNADHRYLSEVIDDGFIVDTLRTAGTRCPKPRGLSLEGVLPRSKPWNESEVLCFALGRAA